ncbi:MAG: ankyrin repeat domain-containing protein [Acidobacteria bacterium]|nr:ankyrin repeat domain-containing protein [Acidobacteriota bacterium]MBI3662307.1 ankyrin repeat domain-containing protein [Acidobacteriota bacterium]
MRLRNRKDAKCAASWLGSAGLLTVLLGCLIVFIGCAMTPEKPPLTEAQKKAFLEANAILTACTASDIEQVKALLAKNPALVNARNDVGETPLWRAVVAVHPSEELVKLLLQRGAVVDPVMSTGETPLHVAAGKGRKELVLILLDHGANINARSRAGWTPLHFAAWTSRSEMADVLLAHGAEIDVFEAAALGKTKTLEEFLRRDAKSVQATDEKGLTPLHWAVLKYQAEAVRVLLAHKADPFAPGRTGFSPCSAARESKHAKIVEMMRCP